MELKLALNYAKNIRKKKLDGDAFDFWYENRLSLAFFILTMISTTNSYVGTKLSCTYTPTIPGSFLRFVNQNCWLEGTYIYPEGLALDDPRVDFSPKKIKYYPIISILLIFGGAILLMPSIFFRALSKKSGMDMTKIIDAIMKLEGKSVASLSLNEQQQVKRGVYENISRNMNFYRKKSALVQIRSSKRFSRLKIFSRNGSYITRMFIIKKILMILAPITIMQIYHNTLDHFWTMGPDFLGRLYRKLVNGDDYKSSTNFPLFAMCDAEILVQFGALRATKVSFECMMTKNIFLDMFFTLVYFLLVAAIIGSVYNLYVWIKALKLKGSFDQIIRNSVYFDLSNYQSKIDRVRGKEEMQELNAMSKDIESLMITDLILTVLLVRSHSIHPDESTKLILGYLWYLRESGEIPPEVKKINMIEYFKSFRKSKADFREMNQKKQEVNTATFLTSQSISSNSSIEVSHGFDDFEMNI
ncbi:MAG: hypothetical protein MHMPM18_001431 [Marteilia pararefringens]